MRKIQTQIERDKKKKKNQIIVGVVMIGLLVLSTAGYAIFQGGGDEKNTAKYGDFKFVKSNELWGMGLGGEIFYFHNLPPDVENVSVIGFYSLEDYKNKPLYFVNVSSGAQEILNNIQRYVLRAQGACLNSNCSEELPVKTCEDNVIVFENSGENKVWKEQNCVHISGDFLIGADAFLYKILGVR